MNPLPLSSGWPMRWPGWGGRIWKVKYMKLRETTNYIAEQSARGVRLTAKDKRAYPKTRVIARNTWEQLKRMSNTEFDGSIVFELGVGCFQKGERWT